MKKFNNIIIIGCSIPSLYAAIKCLDMGYKVSIIDKKNSYVPLNEISYNNYSIYNENHKSYINLLKRFDIKSNKILDVHFDHKLFNIINNICQKASLIPNTILMTYTFTTLCKNIISENEQNDLNCYENIFNGIFNVINALDCINMFKNDILINTTYYHVDKDNVNELVTKMINYIINKNGKIIYNQEIKSIKYIKRKFVLNTNNQNIFTSDLLLTTMSRDNLLLFHFWSNEQKLLLNSVSIINTHIINNMLNKLLQTSVIENKQSDIERNVLLNNLHIVFPNFPNKSKYIYIWNNGINNILLREKIKSMYNDKFLICSQSFSKNNMFINYSIEYVEHAIQFMLKT